MEDEDEISPSQEIDFCTLGMFIIGEGVFKKFPFQGFTRIKIEVEP